MRLANKIAVITGGGSGIGLATAQRFAAEGARVAILGRTPERLEAALPTIAGEAMALPADVAREGEAERAVRAVVERWGRIDVLVNNAGQLHRPALVHELTGAEWDETLTNNLKGYFLTSKAVLPTMMAQRGGSIVMVTSASAQAPALYLATYQSSKAGATGLMRAIAIEYAQHQIRCNAVQVGQTPGTNISARLEAAGAYPENFAAEARPKKILLGRPGTPAEIAAAVLYFASDESAWVTGVVLPIDGGYSSY